MRDNKRRKELQTVKSLVILMLHDPNQTRKEIIERMTGKPDQNRPEELIGISRQSVYKALDFLREAGIIEEKSDQEIIKINRYTIKSVTLSIDINKVWNRYYEIMIDNEMKEKSVINLPEEVKKILRENRKKQFEIMRFFTETDQISLSNIYLSDPKKYEGLNLYLKEKDVEIVMEYLRLFLKKTKAIS